MSDKDAESGVALINSKDIAVSSKDVSPFSVSEIGPTNLETGLTTAEAKVRTEKYGRNEVVIEEVPWLHKIIARYLGLIPICMLTVSILSASIVTECTEGTATDDGTSCECTEARDWISFALLFFELNLIVWVDYFGEQSSGNAIKALQQKAAPTARVKRDGEWLTIPKAEIVPGDIVALVIGAGVPCDGTLRGDGPAEKYAPMKIDGSAVTGEPLPETKRVGDDVLAATTVLSGELDMQATATGPNSSMGEAMTMIASVGEQGGKLKTMLGMLAKGVALIGLIFSLAIFIVILTRDSVPIAQGVKLAFVIVVAVLPVAMPVVVTTGLAVGALELSGEDAIVQRLSAIEEMAGMDILCSDKTGTLTLGKMSIVKADCVPFGDYNITDLLRYSLVSSRRENTDAIDSAVCRVFATADWEDPSKTLQISAETKPDAAIIGEALKDYNETHFEPFSPLTKKVEATVTQLSTGKTIKVAKGAPEIMNSLPGIDSETELKASEIVEIKSNEGYKTLGVCISFDEGENYEMVGYLCIADPPRHDSATTITEAMARGVDVKMITGDQKKIAIKVASQLNLGKFIFGPEVWLPNSSVADEAGGYGKLAEKANGFASVKPKHKFRVVQELQNLNHTVGMTGDGVNDAPALKAANVGIAVADATDAARGAADVVLTREGLSTIVTAINTARIIFRRLESYIVYRLASSCFILGFFFLSIIALKFDFPTWTLILLSIVNDFTVMATSKDNVRTSDYPLKWDVPKLSMLACVIGGIGVLQSFLLLYFLQQGSYDSSSSDIEWLAEIGLHNLEACEMVSVMYLNLAICIQLNIFSARNKRFVWQTSAEEDAAPLPSIILVIPVLGACILSTFLAVYWDENVSLGGGNPMKGCGWGPAGAVWVWAIVWFFIQEVFKVFANNAWDTSAEGAEGFFMAPLTRKFFNPFYKATEDESATESARKKAQQNQSVFLPQTSYDEGDEQRKQALMSLTDNVDHPLVLAKLPALETGASNAQMVEVINALKQHILNLERRVAELDGLQVAQRK